MMTGSEFVSQFGKKGSVAWEAAALALARQGELTPWPWVDLPLSDADGNTAVLKVASDVLSVGPVEDHLRLPLTPGAAQDILNLSGALLPTPWLEYQIWRAAPVKLRPSNRTPKIDDMAGFAAHSQLIDQQIASLPMTPPVGTLISGHKKAVVVSNIYKPKSVLIFGWYRPPPAPDVFDDKQPMEPPKNDRQPIQPKSNVHAFDYVDYSHGIRAIGPIALVNGQPMSTVGLYQHPVLSKLVSNEGPVRVPRYPSNVPVAETDSIPITSSDGEPLSPPTNVPMMPSAFQYALDEIARRHTSE